MQRFTMMIPRVAHSAAAARFASDAAKKEKVLVLCTGNSCRSHMAEGLINKVLGDKYEAVSAGTKPTGYVHPLAIKALDEVGCDISANTSKHTDTVKDEYCCVITVCDNAEKQIPEWSRVNHIHLPFPDPADATGSVDEQMKVFRDVRDQIQTELLAQLESDCKSVPVTATAA